MLFRTCFVSLFLISVIGCPESPDDPSPSNGGNSDGNSNGSILSDAGAGDGSSDGSILSDAGAGDGGSDGSILIDSGFSEAGEMDSGAAGDSEEIDGGQGCDPCPEGMASSETDCVCSDIDECVTDNVECGDHATCENASVSGDAPNCSCNNGYFLDSADDGGGCVAWRTCSDTEYEALAPTATRDRECEPPTICHENASETQAPTETTDRICICNTNYNGNGAYCWEEDVDILFEFGRIEPQTPHCDGLVEIIIHSAEIVEGFRFTFSGASLLSVGGGIMAEHADWNNYTDFEENRISFSNNGTSGLIAPTNGVLVTLYVGSATESEFCFSSVIAWGIMTANLTTSPGANGAGECITLPAALDGGVGENSEGTCVNSNCDDNNPCTDDYYDLTAGACANDIAVARECEGSISPNMVCMDQVVLGTCSTLGACVIPLPPTNVCGEVSDCDGFCFQCFGAPGGTEVCSTDCPDGFHDAGDGTCVSCQTGYHHSGVGTCVLKGACAEGYTDGGDGACVLTGTCSALHHDGGDGACVPNDECSPGYQNGGHSGGSIGNCIPEGNCAPDFCEHDSCYSPNTNPAFNTCAAHLECFYQESSNDATCKKRCSSDADCGVDQTCALGLFDNGDGICADINAPGDACTSDFYNGDEFCFDAAADASVTARLECLENSCQYICDYAIPVIGPFTCPANWVCGDSFNTYEAPNGNVFSDVALCDAVDYCASNTCAEGETCLNGADRYTCVTEGLICDVADECIYQDITMGETLTWQGCPAGQAGEDCSTGSADHKNHVVAVSYCEGLTWGGFNDWVLPNIDELRSLIRGCEKNDFGSTQCSITHQCSYSVDDNCTESSCSGCTSLEGPRSDGCYLPAGLPGACSWFWSSSLQQAYVAYDVGFYRGHVGIPDPGVENKVRCVRSGP